MALLDHLGVEQAVLGGMSQGGFLSLRAALGHPERVRGLVLIDTYSEGFDEQALGFFGGIRDELLANGFNDANANVAIATRYIGDWRLTIELRAKGNDLDQRNTFKGDAKIGGRGLGTFAREHSAWPERHENKEQDTLHSRKAPNGRS